MNLNNFGRPLFLLLFIIFGAFFLFPIKTIASKVEFEGKYDSKSIADSSRKEYWELSFPSDSLTFQNKKLEYDNTFFGSINDLNLKLKCDLSENNYLDFSENLRFQSWKPEDYQAYSSDNYKEKYTNHTFSATFGQSVGTNDTLQLSFVNNILRMPLDDWYDYDSNIGKARYNHRINEFSGLGIQGSFEERIYSNDRAYDFQEGALTLDLFTFIPEKLRYIQRGSSTRGDKSVFEKIPTGLETKQAVDYYTKWIRNPNDPDPNTKYSTDVIMGDLFLNLQTDFRTRKLTQIDNSYYQPTITFNSSYKINDQLKFQFEDSWYQKKFSRESDQFFLYDHVSNKVGLGFQNTPQKNITYILSFSNEQYTHSSRKDQDYFVNTCIWETYFFSGNTGANLSLKESQKKFNDARFFYPNSNQFQASLGFDYLITKDFLFHLKDEWVNNDYTEFENMLYSSFVKNTWKASLEKNLDRYNSLELGYQDKDEKHKNFSVNNVLEKTLFFSWNTRY
ncbi:MAG: hypothetical protein HQM08_12185 [Candidatus Riflebacteria bacterium]|nr:hypothetical protein [Candidatus Riflebacteria bacterium]